MSESKELRKIKKIYGERFMHLCRDLFPTLLETEGKLLDILTSTFSRNCSDLYEIITENELEEEFKEFIYGKVDMEKNEKAAVEKKTPYELLEEAGYDLFECTSEKEVQSYKRYYAPGEELCTFNGGRLDRCVVFFAVRKDVNEIKREDYIQPSREDKYGTSVMGIQFNRYGRCTVSIKNRYNHRVNNPDATYGNDLDRIILGLTQSFKDLLQDRGLTFENTNKEDFMIPGHVVASDGRYYRYNMEVDGLYYCPGNIVIERGCVHHLPNHQMLIDYYVVDFEKKRISLYDAGLLDSFIDEFCCCERMEISKREDANRTIVIHSKEGQSPILIEFDEKHEIVGYENRQVEVIGDNFLRRNKKLRKLELPQLKSVSSNFLLSNPYLNQFDFPELDYVGDNFLVCNNGLEQLELPKLKYVGNGFLRSNNRLYHLKLPKLESVGDSFLQNNNALECLELPQLTHVRAGFLRYNQSLKELKLLRLEMAGDGFLKENERLDCLELPQLQSVGSNFLSSNKALEQLRLPKLRFCSDNFLNYNKKLSDVELPELMVIGSCFLYFNIGLKSLELPQVQSVGNSFLLNNQQLSRLVMPNLQKAYHEFLYFNKGIKELELPCLEIVGDAFLLSNEDLMELKLPKLKRVGAYFLEDNMNLEYLELPELEEIEDRFLRRNEVLKELKLPKLNAYGRSALNKYCRNLLKQNIQLINSQSIATLDKEAGLTDAEIGFVAGKLERGKEIEVEEGKAR